MNRKRRTSRPTPSTSDWTEPTKPEKKSVIDDRTSLALGTVRVLTLSAFTGTCTGTGAVVVEAATFGVVVISTVATAAEAVVVPAVDAGSGRALPIALRTASATALSVARPAVTRRIWFVVGAERAAAEE